MQKELTAIWERQPSLSPFNFSVTGLEDIIIRCEHCEAQYTGIEFQVLEQTGHNFVWNFDYRRCTNCQHEIGALQTIESATIKSW